MRRMQGWWTCPPYFRGCKHSGSTSTPSSCNFYLIEIPRASDARPTAKVDRYPRTLQLSSESPRYFRSHRRWF